MLLEYYSHTACHIIYIFYLLKCILFRPMPVSREVEATTKSVSKSSTSTASPLPAPPQASRIVATHLRFHRMKPKYQSCQSHTESK